VSYELVEDAGFDLLGFLARNAGQACGAALGAHLISGTGTTQPRGVLLEASAGVSPTGTAAGFGTQTTAGQGTDVLIDLQASLAEPYQNQPATAWVMRGTTLAAARKIKNTGDPVGSTFVDDGTGGAAASILGDPVYLDGNMPTFGNTNEVVAYGDWSRYFVRLVNGVRFERSDDFAFDRGDGQPPGHPSSRRRIGRHVRHQDVHVDHLIGG
jgi:HK97 family phage major capsid protein